MQKVKFFISLTILIVFGYFVFQYENNLRTLVAEENQKTVQTSHNIAIQNIESAISSYYFIVLAVKAYTKSLESPPTATELQTYIADYTEEIGFKDSILLSFLDTNHQFVYTVGPQQLDPVGLTGFNVSWFRTDQEIAYLDSVMQVENISLNQPMNLVEGWPAFPFSFNLKYKNDLIYGYIAAVLNTKYLVSKVYNKSHNDKVFHRFIVNDSIDFTDQAVYDFNTIYNENYDSLYFKNNKLVDSSFIYSSYNLFGHNFTLGTSLIDKKSIFDLNKYIFEAYFLLAVIITLLAAYIFFKK